MLYIGIFRGPDAVAETPKGNKAATNFARAIAVTAKQSKSSFTCEQMSGHCSIGDNQDMIIVVCESSRPRRQAFSLIDKIEHNLAALPPQQALDRAVESFSWNDQVAEAQLDIDQVRTVMVDNVDKLLERGERIGVLVDRTQELSTGAHSFRKQASTVRPRFWWKNVQMFALLVLILSFFVVVIYFFL